MQHCERLIRELQTKVLDLQEKVAVAVEVDKTKDEAIAKFHEAWEQVALRLQTLNTEKGLLENEIKVFQQRSKNDLAEATKVSVN